MPYPDPASPYFQQIALAMPPPPSGAPSQQVGASQGGASNQLQVTIPGAINSGDSIVLCVGTAGVGSSVASVSGGVGNPWTLRNVTNNGSVSGSEIWDSMGQAQQAAGPTITLTFSGTPASNAVIAFVIPALKSLDKAAGATGNSTAPGTPSINPAAANEFIVATRMDGHTWLPSGGPTNGFTAGTPTPNNETAAYYLDASSSSPISTAWTIGGIAGWTAVIAAYSLRGT